MSKTIWPWIKDSLFICLTASVLTRLSLWLFDVHNWREKIAIFAICTIVAASIHAATRNVSDGRPPEG